MRRRQPQLRSSPRKRGPRAADCSPWIPACAGMNGMGRRAFIALLGGAVAWPLAARAQQPVMPVIGFLHSGLAEGYAGRLSAFRQGVSETGLVEGRDFKIEFRWAEGNYERLREMAAELVARKVSLIAAAGGVASAPVAKAATATIPIVFITGADPVATGLVTSLARPEANVTGVSFLTQALGGKRLGFLNMLVPGAMTVAVLVNPTSPGRSVAAKEVQDAGRASKRNVHLFEASTGAEIESAFEAIIREKLAAILVQSDPFFTSKHAQIAALGTKAAVPAMYPSREYAEAGGLASYGADVRDEYRKAGIYSGRLLQGAKPADLPVVQPTKFELVINLKTARSIGLSISDSFQLLADEVIE
jgi:putative tryptophan/tyrosine transport system substrate-binding protein